MSVTEAQKNSKKLKKFKRTESGGGVIFFWLIPKPMSVTVKTRKKISKIQADWIQDIGEKGVCGKKIERTPAFVAETVIVVVEVEESVTGFEIGRGGGGAVGFFSESSVLDSEMMISAFCGPEP